MLKDQDVLVEPDLERDDTVWIIPLSERARAVLGPKPFAAMADNEGIWSEIDQHRLRTVTF
jgi:hypothetical protein